MLTLTTGLIFFKTFKTDDRPSQSNANREHTNASSGLKITGTTLNYLENSENCGKNKNSVLYFVNQERVLVLPTPPPAAYMANGLCFPTILVSEQVDAVRNPLVRHLQHQGYFVLIAHDTSEALEIARVHSRPIHLLLAEESLDGRSLAATLKQYRPNMHVLFVGHCAQAEAQDAGKTDTTLAKVLECVKPPATRDILIQKATSA